MAETKHTPGQDREYVEYARPIQQKVVQRLLTIIDRLEAEKAELVEALKIVGKAGSDIAEMADEFIITKDYQSLRNYGANIHTIARTALTDTEPVEGKE